MSTGVSSQREINLVQERRARRQRKARRLAALGAVTAPVLDDETLNKEELEEQLRGLNGDMKLTKCQRRNRRRNLRKRVAKADAKAVAAAAASTGDVVLSKQQVRCDFIFHSII